MIITVTLDSALVKTVFVSGFAPGHVCRAEASRLDPGGKSLEVAKAVSVLGGRGAVLGVAGGAAGEYIRDQLDLLGIQNDLVFTRTETRTDLDLVEAEGGPIARIEEPARAVGAQELQEIWQKLQDLADPGDTVLFAGELPPGCSYELLAEWIGRLRQDGVQVALELSGLAMKIGVAAGPSVILQDPAGLSALCEKALTTREALLRAARRVAENGVELVVVPLEETGVLFVTPEKALLADGLCRLQNSETRLLASVLIDRERRTSLEETAARALAAAASERSSAEDLRSLAGKVQIEHLP